MQEQKSKTFIDIRLPSTLPITTLGAQLCGTSRVAIHYSASKHKIQQIVFVISIHKLVCLHKCAKLINGANVWGVKVE